MRESRESTPPRPHASQTLEVALFSDLDRPRGMTQAQPASAAEALLQAYEARYHWGQGEVSTDPLRGRAARGDRADLRAEAARQTRPRRAAVSREEALLWAGQSLTSEDLRCFGPVAAFVCDLDAGQWALEVAEGSGWCVLMTLGGEGLLTWRAGGQLCAPRLPIKAITKERT